MNHLGKESRALLAAARDADGPLPGAERRVWRALAATGASGAVSVAAQAALAATPATLAAVPAAATWSALTLHLVAGALVGTALVATADVVVRVGAPAPPTAPRPVSVEVAPAPRRPVAAVPRGAPSSEPAAVAVSPAVPPPSPAGARSLTDEASRLERAERSLRGGDPTRTLAELAAYERAYPDGALREEARAARALALCASGRVAVGRGEAERFATDFPASPHLPRVRSGCARDAATPAPPATTSEASP